MIFNSIDFAWFLPLAFLVYRLIPDKSIRNRNLWILCVSLFFYGWWDWRFVSLLLLSIMVDFRMAQLIADRPAQSKVFLWTSVILNLGILVFFKYSNFFITSFSQSFSFLGIPFECSSLNIVLPVGVSFYTFQTLGYVLDVYRGKIAPSRDVLSFGAFVSFFPQLVAGPIERAAHLLPQFQKEHDFNKVEAHHALRQMLWGFFKKLVIADNCAMLADSAFNDPGASSMQLLLGAMFFSFQIYGDFSGYSDIALGTARLFGFRLMRNFDNPYFSRDVAEFWRRWHISLSTWFRDQVYIPLGGSKNGKWGTVRNVLLVFIISGFWHGANWTFIFWGLLHALFFLPLLMLGKNRLHTDIPARGRTLPGLREGSRMLFTFFLVTLAWIFFRAESLTGAFSYLSGIFSLSGSFTEAFTGKSLLALGWILVMMVVEWTGREEEYAIAAMARWKSTALRFGCYYLFLLVLVWFGGKAQTFIYFQF
ncbi:MAG: MBOAT family protein [Bacteroidia bacterium]|nr:MBOAT family protein [Bacteroidia bacterium]